ncbi:MAG: AIM24 family protein, partial [Planctomycetota bacterium]|nr:AIM24 family protein [Planctomycetota bacterium]
MQHELIARPAMTVAKLTLQAGETVTCEVGAMVAMNTGFQVETTSKTRGGGGGIRKGLKRMFSGESFFLNHFTATQPNQMLMIGPAMLGDVVSYPLTGGSLVVQG